MTTLTQMWIIYGALVFVPSALLSLFLGIFFATSSRKIEKIACWLVILWVVGEFAYYTIAFILTKNFLYLGEGLGRKLVLVFGVFSGLGFLIGLRKRKLLQTNK